MSVFTRTLTEAMSSENDAESLKLLKEADVLLQQQIIVQLEEDIKTLNEASIGSSNTNAMAALGIISWVCAAVLVVASILIARTSHRVLNLGLFVAIIAVSVLGAWSSSSVGEPHNAAYQQIVSDGEARTALFQASIVDLNQMNKIDSTKYNKFTWQEYFDKAQAAEGVYSQTNLNYVYYDGSHQEFQTALEQESRAKALAALQKANRYVDSIGSDLLTKQNEQYLDWSERLAEFVRTGRFLSNSALPIILVGMVAGAWGVQRRIREYQ
jgi:hypothetical protein